MTSIEERMKDQFDRSFKKPKLRAMDIIPDVPHSIGVMKEVKKSSMNRSHVHSLEKLAPLD